MTLSTAMMVRMNKTAPSYRDSPPRLIAGALSLDFVNTVEWRSDPARRMERLVDYGELLLWSLDGGDRLADPLWPVLWDAAALLTSANLQRLGRCDDEHCGWVFLDHSRNRSRRWCAMEDCGNRAKARRHYARLKTSGKG